MEKQIINKRELSQYLGFSLGKIDNLIKENKIEYYKIGKNVRFHLNDVDKWIQGYKINLG
ncbi:excisionase family DNA-binding protein [Flavobacteriales bacterium]|jgi:excisionase family DNA binding protein|nr:excisionase family DNA-binding protein [Flavobacteriales bacterium]